MDLFTFNLSNKKEIRLVFHHPAVVQLASPLLEGDWKDRRIAFFRTPESVETNLAELTRIVQDLVKLAEG